MWHCLIHGSPSAPLCYPSIRPMIVAPHLSSAHHSCPDEGGCRLSRVEALPTNSHGCSCQLTRVWCHRDGAAHGRCTSLVLTRGTPRSALRSGSETEREGRVNNMAKSKKNRPIEYINKYINELTTTELDQVFVTFFRAASKSPGTSAPIPPSRPAAHHGSQRHAARRPPPRR